MYRRELAVHHNLVSYPGDLLFHLRGHAARTLFGTHEEVGVKQSVCARVSEAAKECGAGRHTGGTVEGREGPRDNCTVVARHPLKWPGVFARHRRAVGFVAGKVGVHGPPDVVLSRHARNDGCGTKC